MDTAKKHKKYITDANIIVSMMLKEAAELPKRQAKMNKTLKGFIEVVTNYVSDGKEFSKISPNDYGYEDPYRGDLVIDSEKDKILQHKIHRDYAIKVLAKFHIKYIDSNIPPLPKSTDNPNADLVECINCATELYRLESQNKIINADRQPDQNEVADEETTESVAVTLVEFMKDYCEGNYKKGHLNSLKNSLLKDARRKHNPIELPPRLDSQEKGCAAKFDRMALKKKWPKITERNLSIPKLKNNNQ